MYIYTHSGIIIMINTYNYLLWCGRWILMASVFITWDFILIILPTVVKYLGVFIQSHLSWSHHCKILASRASRLLNYLRHSLWGATVDAKSMAYKFIVRPLLEYACPVWSPHTISDKSVLESVQRLCSKSTPVGCS